jgi:hypothetical protein
VEEKTLMKEVNQKKPGLRLGMRFDEVVVIDGIEIQLIRGNSKTRLRIYDPKGRRVERVDDQHPTYSEEITQSDDGGEHSLG